MSYIGNTLRKDLGELQDDRLHFASDKDKLSGLKDVGDLGGGKLTDAFGVSLNVITTDCNHKTFRRIDMGSVEY